MTDIINGSRNGIAEAKPGRLSEVSHAANKIQNKILEVRNDYQGKTRENNIAMKPIKEEPKCTCAEIQTTSDEDARVPSEREQVKAPEGNKRDAKNAKIVGAGSESRGDEKSVTSDQRVVCYEKKGTEDDNPAETKKEDKIVMVPVGAIITEKCEKPSRKESDPHKARLGCRNDDIILAKRETHEVESDHLSSRDSPIDDAKSDNDCDGRHITEITTDYRDQEEGNDTTEQVKPINPEPDPSRTPSWQRKEDDEIIIMHLIKSTHMNTWINAPVAKQWSCTTMSYRKALSEPHIWKFHSEYFEERYRIMMTVCRRKKIAKNKPDLRNIQPAIKKRCEIGRRKKKRISIQLRKSRTGCYQQSITDYSMTHRKLTRQIIQWDKKKRGRNKISRRKQVITKTLSYLRFIKIRPRYLTRRPGTSREKDYSPNDLPITSMPCQTLS
ncbi:15292_t:CDS:2 [Acaulospora morrowiae]|uniref:15292_t:CDS:1 n=1 Tax=Acaulospora morrowiae TaxID=94023 RepID=A0A9N9BWN5_9GLOM|nr:15292_t:CDS:2 [Acaulospora morrowiae]